MPVKNASRICQEDEDVTCNNPKPGVTITNNPNAIPSDDVKFLHDELGLDIGKRLKRGRFGVVYDGEFLENFSLDKIRNSKALHFVCIKKADLKSMKSGQKFAIKYCDIETRKAYNVVDIEERIKKEINFIKRVEVDSTVSIVNTYFVFAITATRYYMVMELADNNLQCIINDFSKANRLLEPTTVVDMYASLVRTIRSLHKQKLTYGMMRTSNVLAFYSKIPSPAPSETSTTTASSPSPATTSPTTTSPVPVATTLATATATSTTVNPTAAMAAVAAAAAPTNPLNTNFILKIADFVNSVDSDAPDASLSVIDESIEQDLDDLFYIHYEIFALTRFDFAKYQAFKESLKVLTEINAHQDSVATLDIVLEQLNKFKREQPVEKFTEKSTTS